MRGKGGMPRGVELGFDGLYLLAAFGLGAYLFIAAAHPAARLWGVMAIVLAAGDCFHLLPRMMAAYTGDRKRYLPAMGLGKLVTSLTMTAFYVLLWHCGLLLFGLTMPWNTALLYVLVAVRVLLCLLPQNQWRSETPSWAMGVYRNIPFALQGGLVAWLYASHGSQIPALRFVWLAIFISFACYLPVVLCVQKHPKLGMLMFPKTLTYLWLLVMGLGL